MTEVQVQCCYCTAVFTGGGYLSLALQALDVHYEKKHSQYLQRGVLR